MWRRPLRRDTHRRCVACNGRRDARRRPRLAPPRSLRLVGLPPQNGGTEPGQGEWPQQFGRANQDQRLHGQEHPRREGTDRDVLATPIESSAGAAAPLGCGGTKTQNAAYMASPAPAAKVRAHECEADDEHVDAEGGSARPRATPATSWPWLARVSSPAEVLWVVVGSGVRWHPTIVTRLRAAWRGTGRKLRVEPG